MIFKLILPVLLVLIIPVNNPAQSNIRFKHLTVKEGLSHSAVTCIFQEKKGFMWFGTQDGLNRYDGYNFKIFKNDPADSNSLTENFIFSIYEDLSGDLFIETQSGTFHKYNPVTETFSVIAQEKINFNGAKFNTINALFIEPSGTKWKGGLSQNTGLTREDKNGKVKVFKHNSADPYSLSDDKVYSVIKDGNENIWVGTINGLDRLDERSGKFIHYRHSADPKSIPDNWIWPIFEDTDGNIWIGTVRGGLSKYDPYTNSFQNYKNDPTDPASINDNYVYAIFQDRSGIIWIGTNTGGVSYFNPYEVFENYSNQPGIKNSLSNNHVLSLFADNQGVYWIGTRTGGLNKFDYSRNDFKTYLSVPSSSNSIATNSIQAIYRDKSGILWVGHSNGGLDAFDIKTGNIKHYKNNPEDAASLSDNRIMALTEDKEGAIWIGTYGGGLNKLDKKSGKIIRYLFNKDDNASISSNAVWSLMIDNNGNLWAGTFGGGINIFNEKDQAFRRIKNDPSNASSLNDNNVIRLYQDSKGTIWVGTTKGLSKYSQIKNSFKHYREKDGLANDYVFGILEDGKGNLWLSTNNGLSKFNPEKEFFHNYYYSDGLQGNEFNQNAFAKDIKTGRLLFGGVNGLTVFDPARLLENFYVPPVVFTDFIRYNTDDKEGKPIIEKGISERNELTLTYKDNIITFSFAALNFNNSFKNQYKYKLEGFNKNWIQLGNNRSVTFTNLTQGDYTLRVIGSNNDGVWNNKGISLAIEVLPPWWRTKIAYALYGIAFISILYWLRRIELKRREQKALIRETELKIKATEAEKRAIAAENERKTKELEEARQLQISMLPRELPKLPNLQIAAYMRTATEVGGDYYDFLVKDNKILNVGFGDATGHGLQAGTMVTLMKGFFTSDAARLELQEFMNHCSTMIKDIKLGRILMSFCMLRVEDNTLLATSAGMPPIYYYDKETGCTEEIIIQGMPLGAMRKFNYKTVEKKIKKGDTILLLSDGLPEQMNKHNEIFDYSRVKDCFTKFANETPEDIISNLVRSGDNWMDGSPQADDMSFVVLKAI